MAGKVQYPKTSGGSLAERERLNEHSPVVGRLGCARHRRVGQRLRSEIESKHLWLKERGSL